MPPADPPHANPDRAADERQLPVSKRKKIYAVTHEERVKAHLDELGWFAKPRFFAAGEYWQLAVKNAQAEGEEVTHGLYLRACTLGFSPVRTDISFALTLVNLKDSASSITKTCDGNFDAASKNRGWKSFIPHGDLSAADCPFLDDAGQICIKLQIRDQMPQPDLPEMPSRALNGNVKLVLDDSSKVRAHSLYLEHASTVLENALACAPQQVSDSRSDEEASGESADESSEEPVDKQSKALINLPLPGVSKLQAQLLVTCLYTMGRETWLDSLGPPKLIQLARVSHKLACLEVLEQVDKSLVRVCGVNQLLPRIPTAADAWLTTADAPAELQLAQQLHLTRYEDLVGRFIGRHAAAIDINRVNPSLAAVLKGARMAK